MFGPPSILTSSWMSLFWCNEQELLELGDRIGHVSTGLRENEISCCLRRTNVPMLNNLSSNFPTETERKCSICQVRFKNSSLAFSWFPPFLCSFSPIVHVILIRPPRVHFFFDFSSQEEYETDDETGKLNCGHFYHIQCIKQWLVQKNICPICKKSAMPQTKTT